MDQQKLHEFDRELLKKRMNELYGIFNDKVQKPINKDQVQRPIDKVKEQVKNNHVYADTNSVFISYSPTE
jgi:hypothetical protein